MNELELQAPFTKDKMRALRAGDRVRLSGTIYTARDAAHKRMVEALREGREIPIPLQDAVIYYVGPTPAPPGRPIGAAGPTTSYRMDAYAPTLLDLGQSGMIGKGMRSGEVIEAMKRNGAVYFAAIGGAGALISRCIKEAEVIAYEDLGAEAVRRLTVKDMPLIVAIDSLGNNLYNRR
ncbi:MAG: Fe-S-containing hydro-lyase [Eubacteriales bacterium]|nr:Fe-S-containing hydro-lyase [Eubacteriales bacterium]